MKFIGNSFIHGTLEPAVRYPRAHAMRKPWVKYLKIISYFSALVTKSHSEEFIRRLL